MGILLEFILDGFCSELIFLIFSKKKKKKKSLYNSHNSPASKHIPSNSVACRMSTGLCQTWVTLSSGLG